MNHRPATRPHRKALRTHLILGTTLVAAALVLVVWPTARPMAGTAAVAAVAVHVLAALLAGAGLLIAALGALWSHTQAHAGAGHHAGAVIRWARFYDVLVTVLSFGREARLRAAALDVAGVSGGERVLDVGCGTGTLALAARARVGPEGTVCGVDASAPMVARARAKAKRRGLDVAFELATAQALPFADGRFDLVF